MNAHLELGSKYEEDAALSIGDVVAATARWCAAAAAASRWPRRSSVSPPNRHGPPSLFAPLRERRPDLLPISIRKPQMLQLSRAVEEESAARAERALMIGAFQRPQFYRASEQRRRRLARGAGLTFVLACFDRSRSPQGGPVEVPIGPGEPVADEWAANWASPPATPPA